MAIKYRADIDGLRAIAVCAVLIYHAEFYVNSTTVLTGGYLGVDIFFVISGFLITKIILKEVDKTGRFSFLRFYERRVRRIAPMLLLVIATATPFAWVLLNPTLFSEYVASIISSFAFVSNFYFYFSTTEYGGTAALQTPFLHTWSLSIEEQFYLFFPFLAIAISKLSRPRKVKVFLFIAFLSLIFAESVSHLNQDLNFYLLPSRSWQLLSGACLACVDNDDFRIKGRFRNELVNIIALVLVLASMFLFDHQSRHPGLITLVPILGVCSLIQFSSDAEGRLSFVGKLLSLRTVVFIGLLSYSLYLWHFPIFAFLRVHYVELSNSLKLIALAISLFISWLSYSFFENKFRDREKYSSTTIWRLSSSSFVLMMCALIGVSAGKSYIYSSNKLETPYVIESDNRLLQKISKEYGHLRKFSYTNLDAPRVLIVGNSHAEGLFKALTITPNNFDKIDVAIGPTQMVCFLVPRKSFFKRRAYIDADIIIVSTRWANRRCDKNDSSEVAKSDIDGAKVLIERALADGKKIALTTNSLELPTEGSQTFVDMLFEKNGDISSDEIAKLFLKESGRFMFDNKYEGRPSAGLLREEIFQLGEIYNIPIFDKERVQCDFIEKTCFALTKNFDKVIYDYGHWTVEGSKFYSSRIKDLGWISSLIEGKLNDANKVVDELSHTGQSTVMLSEVKHFKGVPFKELKDGSLSSTIEGFKINNGEEKGFSVKAFIETEASNPEELHDLEVILKIIARNRLGGRVGGRIPLIPLSLSLENNGVERNGSVNLSFAINDRQLKKAVDRLRNQAMNGSSEIRFYQVQIILTDASKLKGAVIGSVEIGSLCSSC